MIPGTVSKMSEATVASAASIKALADVVLVTGTTQIDTIEPGINGVGNFLVLVPVDGTVILGTTGNIAVGISAVIDRAVFLAYVNSTDTWYINSGV